MVKIVYIKTEHVIPMKILFEVMKDILPDTIIEFRGDPKKKIKDNIKINKKDSKGKKKDDSSDDELNDDSDDDIKSKKKSKKKGKINEKKKDEDSKACIKITNVDPTRSILIGMKLDAKQFQEFVCTEEKYEIGVSLIQLNKMLKTIDKEDELIMSVDSDDAQSLVISMFNNELRRETDFKLKLMDLDLNGIKIPDTIMDVIVTMGSSEFHKVCRNMGNIADYVEIKCTEKSITFSCKGECSEQQTSFGASDNGVKITYQSANKQLIVQGIFELSKLNIFTKCASLCADIQLFMGNDSPLCIQYTVATLGKFLVCIVPVKQTENTFSDEDDLYQSDEDEIKMKGEFANVKKV